ncbi:MAG: DNA-directed RNA polymerase subunit beta' [Anaerolineaceae bacterium 4572_78]|nr:MAG: DNA-directed RNA polymerase subunit beta' [Anaerolineaceae bacterium 4572_78]
MEVKDFHALRISLASPDLIMSWSYGEVTKPETINYRRLRPEKDGLFCEAIFGPTKDWQCYCGKYKGVRYKGITCEKCGVMVTRSSVRRERMGHIALAAPVAHIWYTRRVPSYLGLLLDISRRNLDRVLYFAQYIVTSVDEQARIKVIKKLDDEISRERNRLEKDIQDNVDILRKRLDSETKELQEKETIEVAQMKEEQAKYIEQVMKSAQEFQAKLEQSQGQQALEDMVLPSSDTIIIEAGQEVTSEHLLRLNKAVDKFLDDLKIEFEEEKFQYEGENQKQIDQTLHVIREQVDSMQDKSTQELNDIVFKIEERRQEILNIEPMQFLNEIKYRDMERQWGNVFTARMGAEALYEICSNLDLEKLLEDLHTEIKTTRSKQKLKKAIKRLKVVDSLLGSGNRPEWMILTVLPVIPPDLRPMVQLDGGRFATSDLNDLYRRVINRNNRLKRLLDLGAPDVIVRNEKRMLQEAVDSLIDNSCRGKAVSSRGRRELKSLSDMLKGKQGRFRRNLLGKRVDYSGRSVIVVGPTLELHQVGIPKEMALELFRPFVIQKLVEYNYANNVKGARRLLEKQLPEVWEVLEEITQDRPILLNRAPTLHRLGIQAFEPILVEGSAIHLHPLVCTAFNADFDGDQMAVHVPLSKKAVKEARELMLANKNLLLPANGSPVIGATKDMVLGIYYLTMAGRFQRGKGKKFGSIEEVSLAYSLGKVDLHAEIVLKNINTSLSPMEHPYIETTVGRAIFNEALPMKLRFAFNKPLDKKALKELIDLSFQVLGSERTAILANTIKAIGFKYATLSGTTIAITDINIPKLKYKIVEDTSEEVEQIDKMFRRGYMTDNEQYVKIVELWQEATNRVTKEVGKAISDDSPIRIMADSGATKGGFNPIRQLAGMRGLMADPNGRIIPLPIRSNFREGLTTLEYFISTHGSRKGLADTALRTADAGYLTRRLVDVAQDVIINDDDCGTQRGLEVIIDKVENVSDVREIEISEAFRGKAFGRVLSENIMNPLDPDEIIFEKGQLLELTDLKNILKIGVSQIKVHSPLFCEMERGICSQCYGRDMARGGLIDIGEAVGIIAAQSIGEPGTQLTLRTFHTGGVAGGLDITSGLPRIQELFEVRNPKGESVIADIDGKVQIISHDDGSRSIKIIAIQRRHKIHKIPTGWTILVEDEQYISPNTVLARSEDEKNELISEEGGHILIKGSRVRVTWQQKEEHELDLDSSARLLVNNGDEVKAGDSLSQGSINPHRLLEVMGRETVQKYIVDEVQKVYRSQGVPIHDKHVEIVVRQMTSKIQVSSTRDSAYLPGDIVDRRLFQAENNELVEEGKQPAIGRPVILGITKSALSTNSFLSASSFQHTINVLAQAAIEGKTDGLNGLKENVIIGKLIPAGTGFASHYGIKQTLQPEQSEFNQSQEESEMINLDVIASLL